MLLTYVDESYNSTYHYIAAVLVHEDQARSLTFALDQVVTDAADSYGTPADGELHGHCLFQGKDDWVLLHTMPRARIGIYNRAFEAIADHDVEILLRGVNKVRLAKRYKANAWPPHEVVLEHLFERIDSRAKSRQEWALVIADEVSDADHHRNSLNFYQRFSTSGYAARRITRVVDTVHFAPSHFSRLLQAADLVAFMHLRIRSQTTATDPRARRANEALWQKIAGSVRYDGLWQP